MPFGLYKPGQGQLARGISAAALLALGIWAAFETHSWMADQALRRYWYVGYWVPAMALLAFVGCAYFVANSPKLADFLIDTELEMKKVTWPTYREVLGATVVVIVVVILLGAFLFVVDRWVIQVFLEGIRLLS
jgi:preprotein translocase SecE subunit